MHDGIFLSHEREREDRREVKGGLKKTFLPSSRV